MKEMTAKEVFQYVDDAEAVFHGVLMKILDEIIKDGGLLTHTKLKRLKKKAAFKFMNIVQKEEKKNEQRISTHGVQ